MVTSQIIYKMSPEYQMAYEEGFKDGQNRTLGMLLKVVEKAKNLTAFVETSCTFEAEGG